MYYARECEWCVACRVCSVHVTIVWTVYNIQQRHVWYQIIYCETEEIWVCIRTVQTITVRNICWQLDCFHTWGIKWHEDLKTALPKLSWSSTWVMWGLRAGPVRKRTYRSTLPQGVSVPERGRKILHHPSTANWQSPKLACCSTP